MIPFKYAELCDTGSRWYVYFYTINPQTGKLQRTRNYINSQKTTALRRKLAHNLIRIINDKLDHGWNPFVTDSNKRMFIPLKEALQSVMDYKLRYLRVRSIPYYQTNLTRLVAWLEKIGRKDIPCGDFTETLAQDYMSNVLHNDGIGPRTFNNVLTAYRTFWNYLIKTKHCYVNVFRAIDKLPEQAKSKRPFTIQEQRKYRKFLEENDKPFLVVSLLCYFCGLRPNEIVQLKIKDVNFSRNLINVDPAVSKNKKQRIIPVADAFLPILMEFIKDQPDHYYLVSRKFVPGTWKIKSTRIAGHFREIADYLQFDQEVKFYSLKDTCADMLDMSGVSTKTIRDLFGHSSMAITDQYMQGINTRGLDQLRSSFPDFGI